MKKKTLQTIFLLRSLDLILTWVKFLMKMRNQTSNIRSTHGLQDRKKKIKKPLLACFSPAIEMSVAIRQTWWLIGLKIKKAQTLKMIRRVKISSAIFARSFPNCNDKYLFVITLQFIKYEGNQKGFVFIRARVTTRLLFFTTFLLYLKKSNSDPSSYSWSLSSNVSSCPVATVFTLKFLLETSFDRTDPPVMSRNLSFSSVLWVVNSDFSGEKISSFY